MTTGRGHALARAAATPGRQSCLRLGTYLYHWRTILHLTAIISVSHLTNGTVWSFISSFMQNRSPTIHLGLLSKPSFRRVLFSVRNETKCPTKNITRISLWISRTCFVVKGYVVVVEKFAWHAELNFARVAVTYLSHGSLWASRPSDLLWTKGLLLST